MIIPDHWAEARQQYRKGNRQITVRRFGWSTVSEADARKVAESRVTDALSRILSGEKIDRLERKTAYNGAVGVPIREEVLSRHGEEVITRNAYGAHCLNTPRALFADIDFASMDGRGRTSVVLAWAVLVGLSAVAGGLRQSWAVTAGGLAFALLMAAPVASLGHRLWVAAQGGLERIARQRVLRFLQDHPGWNLRLYKTPLGLRLLATHQPFEASAPEVQQFFRAMGTDPLYVLMCTHQNCFRARLTAKPWRIGISAHMRPRPGLWPVHPERLHLREQWVARYEQAASGFAACHFMESLGSGVVHDAIGDVIQLHDERSRARDLQRAIA